ncbi:aldehyde dehydrogenase (NAD+) [Actinocorallia herbida]|uniref:Aldehyde dehydrogenase (NAD+) n=1 Tax=Actinocorallia herbida TaxID=58109 RepID=A0A3N1D339_9ACTN|nr:aldehyde dehydrogenase family protein [Actinocorallia herbida]ROO87941.1 aldehyde dehydrogenase (NAD+) [Actinocorallia herbida]
MSTLTSSASLPEVRLWLGEKKSQDGSGGVFDHVNPTTGRVQARVPLAGAAEVAEAVEASAAAFPAWRGLRPDQRRDALLRLGALILQNEPELTRIAALENGSPVIGGPRYVRLAVNWLTYYAGWADKLQGSVSGSFVQGTDFTYSQPEPYGVIGAIITWNVPLASLCMKVVPALAAGNTVVVKPSEFTPFTAEMFARLAEEAGLPAGAITVVPGTAAAGQALVAHPKVQKISFTGGPATARKILATCGEHLKPSVMELGGKSANIIFADADLDKAAAETIRMGLSALSGQACILGSRVLVQDPVYDEVVAKLVAAAEALPVGDPSQPGVLFGPVIDKAAQQRILGVIDQAREDGSGKLATGGRPVGGDLANGSFVEPTIFTDVDPAGPLAQNEVFGPVISVMRFGTDDEAVAIANGTEFGLAAYIHSRDVTRVHGIADRLEAGTVYVNGAAVVQPWTPFGGQGESGFGREGGYQGIAEFIRPKTVAIAPLR